MMGRDCNFEQWRGYFCKRAHYKVSSRSDLLGFLPSAANNELGFLKGERGDEEERGGDGGEGE